MKAMREGPRPGWRRAVVFATAIGDCGLAWQDAALTQVLLPAVRLGDPGGAGDPAGTRSLLAHLSGVPAGEILAGGALGDDAGAEAGGEAGDEVGGGAAAEATGSEPPPFVRTAMAAIRALLRGEAVSLAEVPLAWRRVGEFEQRVYRLTQQLAPGETTTYGDLARALGDPAASRAVGVALGRNPWPLVVPCHRVLAAGGKLGGFSAPGGVATKEKLLAIEAPLKRREGELF